MKRASNMVLTDEQLMQELCQGSRPAFELLFQRWHRRMFVFFQRCTGDSYEAEDLCQELFYSVYCQRASFKPELPFKPWVYRIASNLIIDKVVRKNKKKMQTLDSEEIDNPALISREPVSRACVAVKETQERVEQALNRLPEDLRMVLVMRHFDDLTFKEITEALHLPESTVKGKVYRALSLMRKTLKQVGVFESECLKPIG